MRTLLVGGIGYLGYNVALHHARRGDEIVVASRRSSLERRPGLAEEMARLARIEVLGTLLDPGGAEGLTARVCPDILYILVGRLRGPPREQLEANALVPEVWARAARACRQPPLVVYVSSVMAVGDPSACARRGVVVEEHEHLRGCRPLGPHGASKAEGERRVLQACREGVPVLVVRPGLLVGAWSYHREWLLLARLARLRVGLAGGPTLHLTAARDVARIALHALEARLRCTWVYATPYRLTVAQLHELIARGLGVKPVLRIPLLLPNAPLLPEHLRVLAVQSRLVIRPARLEETGFTWTPLEEAIGEAVGWLARRV